MWKMPDDAPIDLPGPSPVHPAWQQLRELLAPLTDWLPPELRDQVPLEAWWLLALVITLTALLVVGWLLRGFFRLFHRRQRHAWDSGLREQLDRYPPPAGSPSLRIRHLPAWLRLVVVAPVGKGSLVDAVTLPLLLDRAVPGLAEVLSRDAPCVRIWPAQLSASGFANAFHRCTPTAAAEGEPSAWVLLAGRAQGAGQSVFLGLGLWCERPTTLGRLTLEPHDWAGQLRFDVGG